MLTACWATFAAGGQYRVRLPGILDDVWYSNVPFVFSLALALAVGLYVASWWLLPVAATPAIVLGALQLVGRRSPWEDSGPPLTQFGWWHVAWWLGWFFVLPLALPIAVRRSLGPRRKTLAPTTS